MTYRESAKGRGDELWRALKPSVSDRNPFLPERRVLMRPRGSGTFTMKRWARGDGTAARQWRPRRHERGPCGAPRSLPPKRRASGGRGARPRTLEEDMRFLTFVLLTRVPDDLAQALFFAALSMTLSRCPSGPLFEERVVGREGWELRRHRLSGACEVPVSSHTSRWTITEALPQRDRISAGGLPPFRDRAPAGERHGPLAITRALRVGRRAGAMRTASSSLGVADGKPHTRIAGGQGRGRPQGVCVDSAAIGQIF